MLNDLRAKFGSLAAFKSRVVRLAGPVRDSGHDLTMLYVGNGTNLAFISDAVFGQAVVEREIGRCNIWRAGAQTRIHASNADMTVIDVPWPYDISLPDDDRVIVIPAWVRQEKDLADTWEGVVASLRKSVRDSQLRKIRKFKLTERTSRDPAEVDKFYDTMYVPHIRGRFGKAASVNSRRQIQNCVSHGTLLTVLRGSEAIGACVLLHERDTLRLLYVGFSAEDLREIDGASAGLYYYTLAYAFEHGFKHVDFMGSRPFLNDGVLAVKRRWGAGIFNDWTLEHLLIQLNKWSPGVESFLASHPMITCQGDSLIGKVLIREGALSADLVNKMSRRFVSPGLDGLSFYSLQSIDDDAFEAANSCTVPVQLIEFGDNSDPLTTYCE